MVFYNKGVKMAESYLIVTKWKGTEIIKHHIPELIRRVEAQGKKARELGNQYEIKLNNGIDYTDHTNLMKSLNENTERYSVCSLPYSQARKYSDFMSWYECGIFIKE
jgi:hypothetical protein